jgi:hypothetical protein
MEEATTIIMAAVEAGEEVLKGQHRLPLSVIGTAMRGMIIEAAPLPRWHRRPWCIILDTTSGTLQLRTIHTTTTSSSNNNNIIIIINNIGILDITPNVHNNITILPTPTRMNHIIRRLHRMKLHVSILLLCCITIIRCNTHRLIIHHHHRRTIPRRCGIHHLR